MPRIVRRPQADADLFDIGAYIALNDLNAAIRQTYRIEAACARLAELPRLGRARDELSAGLRSFTVGSYAVLYFPLEDGVELVRIVHGARNFEAILVGE